MLGLAGMACGATPSSEPATGTTVPGDTTPVKLTVLPTTTTTTIRPARFEFVDYTVAGGIAGLYDHLRVFPDGRAIYDNGTANEVDFTVPVATINDLMAALAAANLPALPPVDTTAPGSTDLIAYRVIYGGHAVTFHDPNRPAALQASLALLDKVMAQGKPKR